MRALHLRILCLATAALLAAGCQQTLRLAETGAGSGAAVPAPAQGSAPLAYASADFADDPRYAAIVMDADLGWELFAENADAPRHPASLTKMMTLFILFDELESGGLSPRTSLPVSANAARQPPSKLGLAAGETIAAADAVSALAIKSANDVAVVVAEAIAGSEEAFARRMNATARRLGLRSTNFTNASGLPDDAQVTTAREMAVLARALQRRFPRYYPVFAQRSFTYRGRTYQSTNRLLGTLDGMDGIKTGYIRASGHNLAASVRRGGRQLLVVVLGGPSRSARDAHVAALAEAYLPERSLAHAHR